MTIKKDVFKRGVCGGVNSAEVCIHYMDRCLPQLVDGFKQPKRFKPGYRCFIEADAPDRSMATHSYATKERFKITHEGFREW